MAQRIGVVLAGGEGRRLGREKGGLETDGRSLARRAAETLWPHCGTVLVSVAPGMANPADGFDVVEDLPPGGRGPLAGLDAAFRAAPGADLLVLACDYPRVDGRVLGPLLAAAEERQMLTMITDAAGRDHPLVGVWRADAAGTVADALSRGQHRVRSLLLRLTVKRVGPAELPGVDIDRVMINVNRPGDLRELELVR